MSSSGRISPVLPGEGMACPGPARRPGAGLWALRDTHAGQQVSACSSSTTVSVVSSAMASPLVCDLLGDAQVYVTAVRVDEDMPARRQRRRDSVDRSGETEPQTPGGRAVAGRGVELDDDATIEGGGVVLRAGAAFRSRRAHARSSAVIRLLMHSCRWSRWSAYGRASRRSVRHWANSGRPRFPRSARHNVRGAAHHGLVGRRPCRLRARHARRGRPVCAVPRAGISRLAARR